MDEKVKFRCRVNMNYTCTLSLRHQDLKHKVDLERPTKTDSPDAPGQLACEVAVTFFFSIHGLVVYTVSRYT